MKKITVLFVIIAVTFIAALGLSSCGHTHTPSDWIEDKAATCSAEGAKHKECTECGEKLESSVIAKSEHTAVALN